MTLMDKVELDIAKECLYIDTRTSLDIVIQVYNEINTSTKFNKRLLEDIIHLFNVNCCSLLDNNFLYNLAINHLQNKPIEPFYLDMINPLNEDINLIIKVSLNKPSKDEILNLYKRDNYPFNILNKYLPKYLASVSGGLKYEK